MINKKTVKMILYYLIMIFFIMMNYGSYGLFLHKYTNEFSFIIPFFISIIILIYSLIRQKKISIDLLIVVIVLISLVFLSLLINNDTATDNFLLIISILTALFIVSTQNISDLKRRYVNVMIFLSIYSLVATYILLPLILNGRLLLFPEYINADRPFVDMFFAMGLKYFGYIRNNGFCREPGVFQFYLLLALFYNVEFLEKNTKNAIKFFILIITLISTFSSIIIVTVPLCLLIFLKKYCNNAKELVQYFIVFLLALICFIGLVITNESIRNLLLDTLLKWNSIDNPSKSSSVRIIGLLGNIELFFERPIWGYGMINAVHLIQDRYAFSDVTGTTLLGLASYGLGFGVITHYLMFQSCKSKKKLSSIIWIIVIFLSLVSQNLLLSYIVWIFLLASVSERKFILINKR